MSRAAIFTITALATACIPQDTDLLDVLPDDRILINMPVDDAGKDSTTKNWATWYLVTAEVTENVNRLVGGILGWVSVITSEYPPTSTDPAGNSATWGPWSSVLDPVETSLEVTYDPDIDIHYWAFNQWPKDAAEEDAVAVVDGVVDPGATRAVNSGRFVVDFDAINEMDPTERTTGLFSVDYDIGEDGVSGTATFEGMDGGNADAEYSYQQIFEGEGSMELVVYSDLNPESGTGNLETMDVRSRWAADGSGRSDILVYGGDLGETTATVEECWSTSFERTWYYNGFSGETEGDPESCTLGSHS